MARLILIPLMFILLYAPAAAAQNLEHIESYIGTMEASIQQRFGLPDEVGYHEGKEAVIWTYILRGDDEARSVLGYRQFAFWNGQVAALNRLDYTPEADSIYQSTLSFLDEGRTTIGRGPAHMRVTRRGDNLWMVDKQEEAYQPSVMLRVGDAGYMMCFRALASEEARVKAKFGIELRKDPPEQRFDADSEGEGARREDVPPDE